MGTELREEVSPMILTLDFSSGVPIYLQIRNEIVLGVADGRLKPGEKLPTIRALADEAGVNTMTVNKAYALLKSEGVIVADRRNGAWISERSADISERIADSEDSMRATKLGEKTMRELKLVIAEAKLSGMTENEFLHLCAELFRG
jgi:DNA-binding transcriptional regulator YhcF (GntR family)